MQDGLLVEGPRTRHPRGFELRWSFPQGQREIGWEEQPTQQRRFPLRGV